jgi:hypothetical protein
VALEWGRLLGCVELCYLALARFRPVFILCFRKIICYVLAFDHVGAIYELLETGLFLFLNPGRFGLKGVGDLTAPPPFPARRA